MKYPKPTRHQRTSFVVILLLFTFLAPLNAQPRGRGQTITAGEAGTPQDFRSPNFILHTDIGKERAGKLLKDLETMLRIISTYWGHPNRKPIECYVVEDLDNWPQGLFPPDGHAKIAEGAGVTKTTALISGTTGRPINANAIVYAVPDHGTPLHEAVHAYCGQNFGHTGPTWYSEGMAEMGAYWRENDTAVLLPEVVLSYLQESDPKPMMKIVNNTDQTGDSWENYAWRWALCHMLAYNDNYAKRFRPLGLNFLQNRGGTFEQTYGAMEKEITFEYRFFLDHLENGLRADLISWDWNTKFTFPRGKRPIISKINAQSGWQPSRIKVAPSQTYAVTTKGDWQVTSEGDALTADGTPANEEGETDNKTASNTPTSARGNQPPSRRNNNNLVTANSLQTKSDSQDEETEGDESEEDEATTPPPEGAGQLWGVILDTNSMSLSEPFQLGTDSTFTADTEGQLYLRCKDGWGQLADNKGSITVTIRLESP